MFIFPSRLSFARFWAGSFGAGQGWGIRRSVLQRLLGQGMEKLFAGFATTFWTGGQTFGETVIVKGINLSMGMVRELTRLIAKVRDLVEVE